MIQGKGKLIPALAAFILLLPAAQAGAQAGPAGAGDAAFAAEDFAGRLEERGEADQRLRLASHPGLSSHPELAAHPGLWHLHNFGQEGGRPGADIGWLDAMAHDERAPGYDNRIGVLDTGVDLGHPELAGRICRLEEPGNGVDDDGNGFVDDAWGWDFAANDPVPEDPLGHGTLVAGLIAARDDATGGLGVIGVAREACVVPIRVFDRHGFGRLSHLIAGIRYASRLRLPVLNVSAGVINHSMALEREVWRARARGTLIVAAAGNDGKNADRLPFYPAAFDGRHIVSVGASDRRDRRAGISNWGRRSVDLFAPGAKVRSARPGAKTGTATGTSFAAPLVSAAASELLRSASQLGPEGLRRRLLRGAERRRALRLSVSGGRLSLAGSLRLLPADRSTSPPRALRARRLGPGSAPRRLRRPRQLVRFAWRPGEKGQRFLLVVDGGVRRAVPAGRRSVRLRLARRKRRRPPHRAFLIAVDRPGNEARSKTVSFR